MNARMNNGKAHQIHNANRFGAMALALAIAAGGLSGVASARTDDKAAADASLNVANSLSTAFRSAAAKIDPSVVSILVTKKAEAPTMSMGGGQIPEEFKRFFGNMAPNGGPQAKGQKAPSAPKSHGEGSGVIVSDDGKILTNNHVVADSDSVRVKLSDGRELDAKILGTDPETDLAVIKVDATSLTAARIGDSESLQPGDWVVAVGSPFGLDHTVTAGVVSAKSRADVGLNTFEDFIQTDAAINPGNSGGPLINLKGEVVGIYSAIRTGGGMGSNGIGFAIPSTTFNKVMDSLIANGKVERGWLGVATQPLTQDLATSLSAAAPHGALVSDVMPETPAAKAGLKSGDIITAVNGRAIASNRELVNSIGGLSPGEKADLKLLRDGDTKTLTVKLGTRPAREQLASAAGETKPDSALGMSLQPLTGDLAKQLGLKDTSGVLISEIEDDSPAAEAGLEAGDVILQAGGKDATSPEDVAAAAKQAKSDKTKSDKGLLLKVRHQNNTRFVVIKTSN